MFFLFLAYPVLEIYLLFKIGAIIGLANTFFYLLASAVFGIGLIRSQGAFLMRNAQNSLAAGKIPANQMLHSILIFLSGAFFIFPGFISDVVGLFLLLPGTRHLAAYLMKKKFAQMLQNGSVRFASNGFGFSTGFTQWPNGMGPQDVGPQPMRDVSPLEIDSQSNHEVIDITPIKKPE
jgi:UPF0716 protein FxsA